MDPSRNRLPTGGFARLVPELDVFDLEQSDAFWCGILSFQIAYQRPENRFIYIELQGSQVMLNHETAIGRPRPLNVHWGAGSTSKCSSIPWPLLSRP